MPRNGSDLYYIPPGTEGFPDTTIESEKYNSYIHDVETDLNTPRPVVAGGTGANNAKDARTALGAEASSQHVLNYDSHVWENGSFWSVGDATAGPIDGHMFGGTSIVIDNNPDYIILIARDQSDGLNPGRVYVREKSGGVWGQWSQDNTGVMSATPPVNPPDGLLWWDNISGQLYVYYNDGDTKQWVIASPSPDPAQFLLKAGDKMEGTLELQAGPTASLHAASKEYVDSAIASIVVPVEIPAGSVMFFHHSVAPTGWTRRLDYDDCGLRLVSGEPITAMGGNGWSYVFSQTVTQGHALEATEQANMNVVGTFSGSGSGTTGLTINRGDGSLGWAFAGATSVPFSEGSLGVTVSSVSGSISGTAQGNGALGNYHTHPVALNLKYIDVIMATKN